MGKGGFTRSVRGKVIMAVVMACCALVLAWSVSKIAFRQMLGAVQHTAAPSTPWRVAGELSAGIARLEGLERQDLRPIHLLIDTLRDFYAGDSLRLTQVNTLSHLLSQRDKLVSDYLRVRADMLGDSSLSQQVRTLRERPAPAQKDSTVVTTERKSYTTTVYPGAEQPHEKAPRGFLRKLFGSKKKTAPEPGAPPYQVVHEEMHTHVDTIAMAPTDTTDRHIDAAMENLERNRRLRSAMFLDREAGLAAASDRLNRQIVLVLRQVEQDAVEKMEASNAKAEQVVHTGITRINAIMFSFFLITAVLLYFILTDIARSNKYRQEIEDARDLAEYHSKAKQRFLSNMSHEIRTPLQSIVGYSERIRAQGYAAKRDIDALHHSAEHLMQIVNEVLDYNRIVSGKFTFTRQVFSLPVLLDEVVSVMRLQADARSLALTTHFSFPEGLALEGDPFRLKQVLYNLLGNAIKFTALGWVDIAVSYNAVADSAGAAGTAAAAATAAVVDPAAAVDPAASSAGTLVCTVSDTGPGIAPDDLERIFQEFEQAEDRHGVGGTGLGLPISKALVENQGGSLSVSSVIGSGSVFTVSLPCARAASVTPALNATLPFASFTHKMTWILDDDPFILDVCSWMLSRHHLPHRCFSTPASLLNEPWDPAVGYLLLDIRMPGMNGLELCAALRPRIPPDVRIFALTAQVLPDEQAQVLAGGFDGLLLKPFTEESLLGLYAAAPASVGSAAAPSAAALQQLPVDPAVAVPEWDLSGMERMTFGDNAQLARMLRLFVRDQREDKTILEEHLYNQDVDGVHLLVHRIAGRTGQVGARRLAADFRRVEKTISRSRDLGAAIIKQLQEMCKQLEELIRLAEEKAAGLTAVAAP